MTAYLNKKFIPLDKARVSVLDRGFLYGDGVFETMRSYAGRVFSLEEHAGRLFNSLKTLSIRPPVNRAKIKEIIYALLRKNRLKDAYIKVMITRGNTVAVYMLPYKPLPEKLYRKGVKMVISASRLNEKSGMAGHKTLNYLHNILCRREAERRGAFQAILLNTKGHVSEAANSNIFLVKNGILLTPRLESGCLPGVTRKVVIDLAGRLLKKKTREGVIRTAFLRGADEVFVTNSLAEILPVVKIEKNIVGNGKPGPVTKKLREAYKIETKR